MFKNAKIFILVGFLLVAALGAGIYLSLQNSADREPIRVYKTTPLHQQKALAIETAATSRPTEETPQANYDETTREGSLHSPAEHDHYAVEHTPASHDSGSVNAPPDELELDVPLAETTLEFETEAEIQEWFAEEIERLTAEFYEAYPELATLQYMTPQEIRDAYPTPEDRAALKELVKLAQDEFWEDIRNVLSTVSPNILDTALEIARNDLAEIWGSENANLAIEDIRAKLGR